MRNGFFLLVIGSLLSFLSACGNNKDNNDNIAGGGDAISNAGVSGGGAGITATGGSGQSSAAGQGGQTAVPKGGSGAVSGTAGTVGSKAGSGGSAAAGAGGIGTAGSSAGAGGAAGGPPAACVSALKAGCKYHSTDSCSSYITTEIYKDASNVVESTELQLGPYGAIMEFNLGKDFANPINASESSCALVAGAFGEPEKTTQEVLDMNIGTEAIDISLYTVYRPACMIDGEKYPVITWGNGTCGQTEGYGGLLRYVASWGYVVFASNSRYTGDGTKPMLRALDFAFAANEDSSSKYYHKLDTTKVGAMGHSQGGGATVDAASDDRVKAVIIWNAAASAAKPFLAVSGDNDIAGFTPDLMDSRVNGATQPGAWLFYHKIPVTGNFSGHLTLMSQPQRVVKPATAWWDYILKGDTKARDMFLGDKCGLCGTPDEFEYGYNSLLK